ncbi:PREDICTED: uncharacterized protein LOC109590086 [Amphimedon queenslandica]|uniref:DUF4218 domain-containing protein n=2 Tax=Amphimedon queenslandica TaxID=400682 RepID=A0AAN0JXF1_AMPQE|nr:PREDICTED: uncharacterized protein LOC109590086 [Amphimedon queenslandica]|eukprot:XP_019861591.1 PREDICTED: uncharacterized protein LOC109590086 [Amphimedon queenslandica]
MHTLFEGVASHHLQALLEYLIKDKKSFTLAQLNTILRTHKYSNSETKPSPINKDNDGSFHIKQTASQMMTLVRLFPFLCGNVEVENDKHWDCYLILLAICDMACSFDVQESDPTKFGWMVQVYLESFVTLYSPQFSVTPKMHYLVHLPKQMTLFGPLRHHWCMRFESKNAQIKSFVTRCFRNVPLSVAIRHQQYLSYHLYTPPERHSSNFLYGGDQVSGDSQQFDHYREGIEKLLDIPNNSLFGIRCKFVIINGIEYKPGYVIRIKPTEPSYDFDYGLIDAILMYEGHKIFLTTILEIKKFHKSLCAFEVSPTHNVKYVLYGSLYCHGVVHIHTKSGNLYIIEKNYCFKDLWCLF